MRTIKAFLITGLFLAFPCTAFAIIIEFSFNSGVICQLEGPCQTNDQAFFDVVPTTFPGTIQPDGTFLIDDTISLVFDGGSQFIEMTVANGILQPEDFNGPVIDGELPDGNWLG